MSHQTHSLISNPNDFVDIHGREIKVFTSEQTGDILIPLCEIKSTGFHIFRKSQFDRLLVDESEFNEEFNLFMLNSAKTYMLKNKITFRETDVLDSINNCKKLLKDGKSVPRSPQSNNISLESNDPKNTQKPIHHSPPSPQTIKSFTANSSTPQYNKQPRFEQEQKRENFANNNQNKRDWQERGKPPGFQTARNGDENGDSQKNFKGHPNSNNKFAGGTGNDNRITLRPPRTDLTEQKKNTFPSITLEKPEHEVTVTYVEKTNVVWVQDVANIDVVLDIFTKCSDKAANMGRVFKPVFNKMYLAEDEGTWYRCALTKQNPLTVFFIDFGNSKEVDLVKECPEEIVKFPKQAVRISFDDNKNRLKEEDTVKIKPFKQFDDGTVCVNILNGNANTSDKPKNVEHTAKPKTHFNIPESELKLQKDQRVLIVGHEDGKLFLRTKEGFDKLKFIEKKLNNFTGEKLDTVSGGQIILAVNKDDGKLRRAVVNKTNNEFAEIQFVDYGNKAKYPVKSFQNITEELVKEPVTYIVSPYIKGVEQQFSEDSIKIIEELIKSKTKCTVISAEKNEFDLLIDANLTLSKKLGLLNDNDGRIFLHNLKMLKPEIGNNTLICSAYKSVVDATFTLRDADEDLVKVIKLDLEDTVPYEPLENEVCWVKYQDEYYRGVIRKVLNNKYEVYFIDFGNTETLTKNEIRKLTDDVMDIPILGLACKLTGLPKIANIEATIKEKVCESGTYEVIVKSYADGKFEIEIPAVYEEIKRAM